MPCKVGDTVFGVGFFDCDDRRSTDKKERQRIFKECMKMNGNCEKCKYGHPSIEQFFCTHIQIGKNGWEGESILVIGARNENYCGKDVFTTREAAEARLAELKGGSND